MKKILCCAFLYCKADDTSSHRNCFAASLGQVYKGRLKENGDLVAVKVQRPFVLETVTVDLFIIRNLGLVLRKFPQVGWLYPTVASLSFYLISTFKERVTYCI